MALICRDSQRYKEFRQYVTAWPPGTPVVPSPTLVSIWSVSCSTAQRHIRHMPQYGIAPSASRCYHHVNIHTRYLIPNQDQDVTYLVPVVILSPSGTRHVQEPRAQYYLFIYRNLISQLTSTVFHNHIGIVWIMSASHCFSEILRSNYAGSAEHILHVCVMIAYGA